MHTSSAIFSSNKNQRLLCITDMAQDSQRKWFRVLMMMEVWTNKLNNSLLRSMACILNKWLWLTEITNQLWMPRICSVSKLSETAWTKSLELLTVGQLLVSNWCLISVTYSVVLRKWNCLWWLWVIKNPKISRIWASNKSTDLINLLNISRSTSTVGCIMEGLGNSPTKQTISHSPCMERLVSQT